MEFVGITITGWAAVIVTLTMAVLTVMMAVLGKEKVHYTWSWFCLIVTVWIGAFYVAIISKDPATAELWWKISYVGVILMPFAFFHFITEFIDLLPNRKNRNFVLAVMYVTAGFFIILDLHTNLIINGVQFLFNEFYYGEPGIFHPYFMAIYGFFIISCFYLVYSKYKQKKGDHIFQQRVVYFFISNLIAFVGGSLNFLPIYGIRVSPVSNVAVALGAALLSYAILKYRLFNARIVTAQLLTFMLVAFSVVRLIVSESFEIIIFNILLLIITLFVGLNLIESVRREVSLRESLEVANEGQTNLIHIINHQIKGYLSKSRNIFSELLVEPSYGPISEASKPMLEEGFRSLTEGVSFVQGILDSASVEEGTFTYNMAELDMRALVLEVVEKQRASAEKKKLSYEMNVDNGDYHMKGDASQLKEAVRNLIDNSIIYTENGGLKINLSQTGNPPAGGKILLAITDTGVGITAEDKARLFTKGGKGKNSMKINVNSSGYGLTFVKGVAEAHHGHVWAESEGPGHGSQFYMELPIDIKQH